MTVGDLIEKLGEYDRSHRIVIGVHSGASFDECGAETTHGYTTQLDVSGHGDDNTSASVFVDVYGVEMALKTNRCTR